MTKVYKRFAVEGVFIFATVPNATCVVSVRLSGLVTPVVKGAEKINVGWNSTVTRELLPSKGEIFDRLKTAVEKTILLEDAIVAPTLDWTDPVTVIVLL